MEQIASANYRRNARLTAFFDVVDKVAFAIADVEIVRTIVHHVLGEEVVIDTFRFRVDAGEMSHLAAHIEGVLVTDSQVIPMQGRAMNKFAS